MKGFVIPNTERLRQLAALWSSSTRPRHIETPGPGQESVWDFPRPPAADRLQTRIHIYLGEQRIADTRAAVRIMETASPPTVYLPPGDIEQAYCIEEAQTSHCEWKGEATYLSVRVGDSVARHAAWTYRNPYPEYAFLKDYVSFYPARVCCMYGEERVQAQPGRFYGGWVTSQLTGPFKGEPGTQGW